eukprot:gene6598-7291_t
MSCLKKLARSDITESNSSRVWRELKSLEEAENNKHKLSAVVHNHQSEKLYTDSIKQDSTYEMLVVTKSGTVQRNFQEKQRKQREEDYKPEPAKSKSTKRVRPQEDLPPPRQKHADSLDNESWMSNEDFDIDYCSKLEPAKSKSTKRVRPQEDLPPPRQKHADSLDNESWMSNEDFDIDYCSKLEPAKSKSTKRVRPQEDLRPPRQKYVGLLDKSKSAKKVRPQEDLLSPPRQFHADSLDNESWMSNEDFDDCSTVSELTMPDFGKQLVVAEAAEKNHVLSGDVIQALEEDVCALIEGKGGKKERSMYLYRLFKSLAASLADMREEIDSIRKDSREIRQQLADFRDAIAGQVM